MTDYEYILEQCRQFSNSLWDDKILKVCIDKLNTLSDKELCDLLLEKEVHAEWTYSSYSDMNYAEKIEDDKKREELKSAIIKPIPTIKLVEILYSSPNDYIGKNGRERSIEFLNIFRQAYNLAKEELGRRYLANIDCKIIENAFNHTSESNKEWLKWQKRKRKISESRYQDPYLKSLEEYEFFFTQEDLDHGIVRFNNVISIKGCRHFFDEGGKRIGAIYRILSDLCGVVPQYIGLGDEVVLAVSVDDFFLHSDYKEYLNDNLVNKIIDKEYQRNLVLGCLLVEKFIHIVDPKLYPKVRCYERDYLIGHFVVENNNVLFNESSIFSVIDDLAPKDRVKFNSFIDLVKNLTKQPEEVPF